MNTCTEDGAPDAQPDSGALGDGGPSADGRSPLGLESGTGTGDDGALALGDYCNTHDVRVDVTPTD